MLTFEETISGEVLNGRYLVLELAAILDRLDLAAAREGRTALADPRVNHLTAAIAMLLAPAPDADRAARILRHYSDPEK